MIRWLKQLLCRHEYRLSRFQALGSMGDYECTKCRKMVYDCARPRPNIRSGGAE